MLPASNRGVGMNICAPDVCATPPLGVPVPYVNMAMNAMAVPFAIKTFLSFVNALNQGSMIPLTMGDQPGAMSPFMGPGMVTVGNPKIFVEALPATHLMCPAAGNNMIAPLGAVLVPSVTNVFYTYAPTSSSTPEAPPAADWLSSFAVELEASRGLVTAVLPGDVAYVKVEVFASDLPARVYHLLTRALPCARALVLDLRGCPGGELMAAVELAGDFLPHGSLVATLIDADGDETVYRSHQERPYQTPLLLLVDRTTASAAEVFAGALQAHGRAVVAGEPTFGKGVAQRILPARGASGASYATVATVTLPSGIELDGVGVQPDLQLQER